MPDGFAAAAALLPPPFRAAAEALPEAQRRQTEEFRLRAGMPGTCLIGDAERPLGRERVTEQTLREVLDAATRSSFHAVSEELRQGFLAAPGGVRVGVCGSAVTEGGILTLREISSLSLRIPRQLPEAAEGLPERLGEASVLILSPPGGGKTTLLRELVRRLSDGGTRVGLVDERRELAAMRGGVPGFAVGRCTDVLSGAPKAEAALLLLRAMNPQVIAMDEISAPEDAAAVLQIAGCGVRLLATAHAERAEALRRRPVYRRLLEEGVFSRAVVISRRAGRRSYAVEAL